jgi:cysteinyl-tRNA synthetase
MALRLHNTLTRRVEPFTPIDPANVRMYVCGPTVYDYAHIGNARAVLVFDILFRMLRHLYGAAHVRYARNITDVDDKIIAAHQESGEPIDSITRRTTQAFHDDIAALGALPPTVEPRATAHIAEMIALTEKLLANGHAYAAEGHVLFNVPSMADYGKLSRRNRDELIAGARVEVAPYKKDPADFVLWKPSSADQPGWDSPWGRGRPGWHLECSAMSAKHLGERFDIHGGGIDLIFPHHENEIAQSTCAHGPGTFANVWVHNGFLSVEGEKMSKSLGNFITIRDALKQHHGETIRLAMLKTHYRQPLDWTAAGVQQAKDELDRLYGALRGGRLVDADHVATNNEVVGALENDLNTPDALHFLHVEANAIHRSPPHVQHALRQSLRWSGGLLGILQQDPEAWFKWQPDGTGGLSDTDVDDLIKRRADARKTRDFKEADRIRDQLAEAKIILEDGAGGTSWRRG